MYDGLGRVTTTYVGYCPSGGTLAQVPTLTSNADLVFQQNGTTYDPAGNVIFMASRSRLAMSGTATGGLSSIGRWRDLVRGGMV